MSQLLLGTGCAVALLIAVSPPAAAHVAVSPATVAPATFSTFTFTVPNEAANDDTIGIDLSLPAGFVLEDAQSVPGWKTVVDTRADRTLSAVHWTGGLIPPHTFASFSIRGRVRVEPGAVAFDVQQHYRRKTEQWTGAPDSAQPAPRVTIQVGTASGRGVGGADPGQASGVAQVPLAARAANSGAAATDSLSRSRADLALILALAALIVTLALIGLTLRRSMTQNRLPDSVPALTDPKARSGESARGKK